ncbi:hypothetical protein GGR52DRAFT_256460 [Hypoxylon sp. FL1284]|nr:hypothetical protein GGR52DRAFT_256460 [Hypoxylon sp. FL1284]
METLTLRASGLPAKVKAIGARRRYHSLWNIFSPACERVHRGDERCLNISLRIMIHLYYTLKLPIRDSYLCESSTSTMRRINGAMRRLKRVDIATIVIKSIILSVHEYLCGHPLYMLEALREGCVFIAKSKRSAVLFSRSPSLGVGLNLYGYSVTLLLSRISRGHDIVGTDIRNAEAVARMHLDTYDAVPPRWIPGPIQFPYADTMSFPTDNVEVVRDKTGRQRAFAVTSANDFSKVSVGKPVIRETTNDFTKKLAANARHWKARLYMRVGDQSYRVIRANDVIISTNPTKNLEYASKYAYVGLPEYVRQSLEKLITAHVPVTLLEPRFAPSSRWWKAANSVENLACTLTTAGELKPVDLKSLLTKTGKAVRISCDFVVDITAKTDDGKDLPSDYKYGCNIEVIRGIIQDINVDEPPPTFVSTNRSVVAEDLSISKKDATPDSVLTLLENLSL